MKAFISPDLAMSALVFPILLGRLDSSTEAYVKYEYSREDGWNVSITSDSYLQQIFGLIHQSIQCKVIEKEKGNGLTKVVEAFSDDRDIQEILDEIVSKNIDTHLVWSLVGLQLFHSIVESAILQRYPNRIEMRVVWIGEDSTSVLSRVIEALKEELGLEIQLS